MSDPIGDWFRNIGTKLSNDEYEEGIRLLFQDQLPVRPGDTGWATVKPPGQTGHQVRVMRIAPDQKGAEVWVSATDVGNRGQFWHEEHVSDFVPDVLLTEESYNNLRRYAKDVCDDRAGVDGDVIELRHADSWARRLGLRR